MLQLQRIEISNFKSFSKKVKLKIDQLNILVGPNNSGKTTVLHALSLWNIGLKNWYDKKSGAKSIKERTGVPLNIRSLPIPITDARQLWHEGEVLKKTKIPVKIVVGLHDTIANTDKSLGVMITYTGPEVIYCTPTTMDDKELLNQASSLDINLLYTLSGVVRDEKRFGNNIATIENSIAFGEGSQVLRNICYLVYNEGGNDKNKKKNEKWEAIKSIMTNQFSINLYDPELNKQGNIILKYSKKYGNHKQSYDIVNAGLGQNQVLMILAYLARKPGSIVVLDEPDAHLETLRQGHLLVLFKEWADKYNNQFIICTHSEVMMNEGDHVGFIYNTVINNPSQQEKKAIKASLKDFGLEEYVQAQQYKKVLYLEGQTDFFIIREFAKRFHMKLYDRLLQPIFIVYTQPDNTEKREGGKEGYAKKHFNAVSGAVRTLKGLGLFDSDGKICLDIEEDNYQVMYRKNYEIENYFINEQTLVDYIKTLFDSQQGGIFYEQQLQKELLILDEILKSIAEAIKLLSDEKTQQKKSDRAERILEKYTEKSGHYTIRKGAFYQFVEYASIGKDHEKEIKEKLGYIYNFLK